MNRYIARSAVAILTFCIGLAVGSRPHRTYRGLSVEKHCPRIVRLDPTFGERHRFSSGPFLTVDTAQSDPVKLSYSSTIPEQTTSWRQRVEFQADKFTSKGISSYSVSYRSSSNPDTVHLIVMKSAIPGESENVSLECDAKDTLTVWVSDIQFKDGTKWENPRHHVDVRTL
jgi:hypothetical protein